MFSCWLWWWCRLVFVEVLCYYVVFFLDLFEDFVVHSGRSGRKKGRGTDRGRDRDRDRDRDNRDRDRDRGTGSDSKRTPTDTATDAEAQAATAREQP